MRFTSTSSGGKTWKKDSCYRIENFPFFTVRFAFFVLFFSFFVFIFLLAFDFHHLSHFSCMTVAIVKSVVEKKNDIKQKSRATKRERERENGAWYRECGRHCIKGLGAVIYQKHRATRRKSGNVNPILSSSRSKFKMYL